MDELIAFVAARLDEDEATAKAAGRPAAWRARSDAVGTWVMPEPAGSGAVAEAYSLTGRQLETAEHIARHDPARVLREVEAKRARLALMADVTAEMDRLLADEHASRVAQAMAVGRARSATVAVKHDAAIWVDHPDYQQKWALPA